MAEAKVKILSLHGSWYEMGREYGERLSSELRHVLAFVLKESDNVPVEYFAPHGLPIGVSMVDELFRGVAEGAGLTPHELLCINSVELVVASQIGEYLHGAAQDASRAGEEVFPGKCSALALYGKKTKNGELLYGRNYDWVPALREVGLVLTHFHPTGSGISLATLNFPGCLYLTTGMNSTGLFLELNDGSFASKDVNDSQIHNAWRLWEVLTKAQNAPQAGEMLSRIPAQYSYLIGVADATQCFSIEWWPQGAVMVPGSEGALAMANHFVHSDWKNLPLASVGGALSSVCRRQALLNQASRIPEGTADLETMKGIFDLSVEACGARWEGTLFQVLAVPAKRQMVIRPQGGEWTDFQFPSSPKG